MTVSRPSLRERSKTKRRTAIQRAAMSLFAERGYDATTIVDIAEAADVAPRTVSLYFPAKLDIAMSASNDKAARLTAAFQQYPQFAFTDVIDRWLTDEGELPDQELSALSTAMFDANPALRAVSTAQLAEVAGISGPALLAQIGRTPDDPLTAIAGAAVGAAIDEYVTITSRAGASAQLHQAFMRYLQSVIDAAAQPG